MSQQKRKAGETHEKVKKAQSIQQKQTDVEENAMLSLESADAETGSSCLAQETSKLEFTLDFSGNELPPQISKDLDELLKRIADLEKLVNAWIKITPAERASYFSDSLEEERMSLWIMNAMVSLGEVYCKLQGMNPWTEGIETLKDTLNRYARKFDELEPHAHLLSRTDVGPSHRLVIPAVKRFLKSALIEASIPSQKQ